MAYGRVDLDPDSSVADWPRDTWPLWARWNGELGERYTLGVEEELMLLEPRTRALAQSSDQVFDRLSPDLSRHTSPETLAAVIELVTGIHPDVDGAMAELTSLRHRLAHALGAMGLRVAAAGTHPLTVREETEISSAMRYRTLGDSLRVLARREPTMALRVCMLVPTSEVLAENRFLAARDGMDARLIDPAARCLIPVREMLERLLADCRPHALAVGCVGALDLVHRLAAANGATHQRTFVAPNGALDELVASLADRFLAPDLAALVAGEVARQIQRPTERSGICAAGSHTPVPPS